MNIPIPPCRPNVYGKCIYVVKPILCDGFWWVLYTKASCSLSILFNFHFLRVLWLGLFLLSDQSTMEWSRCMTNSNCRFLPAVLISGFLFVRFFTSLGGGTIYVISKALLFDAWYIPRTMACSRIYFLESLPGNGEDSFDVAWDERFNSPDVSLSEIVIPTLPGSER